MRIVGKRRLQPWARRLVDALTLKNLRTEISNVRLDYKSGKLRLRNWVVILADFLLMLGVFGTFYLWILVGYAYFS